MSANRDLTRPLPQERRATPLDAVLLSDFSLYALRESAPARLIERAATLTAQRLEVDFCTVIALEPDGEALRVVGGYNWPAERLGRRMSVTECAQCRLALEHYSRSRAKPLEAPQPVVIEDLRLDGCSKGTFRVRELGVVSSLCVVIPGIERPYGILVVHSRAARRFDAGECEFLQAVANVLSAALARCSAHARLQDGEARFRSLAKLSSDWYWEQDADLRFTYVSEGFFERSSIRRENVLGKRRWEFSGGLPVDSSWEAHRATLEAHLPFRDFEFERVETNGKRHYQSTSGDPVFDAEGRFNGYRGTGRDVTERRKTLAALRESEDRYRDLVEHSQNLICTHELDGRIRSVNPWAANALGYEPAELLNMNVRDLLAPERRSEFADYIGRLEKDGVASGLMLVQARSGEKRVWKYANSLRTQGVSAPIVRGMAHDVTEQSRAERALAEREELLRATFDHAPGGISVYDVSGRLIKANRALQSMLGYSEDELRQMTLADLIHPEERSESRRLREELIAGKRTRYASERRYLRKDGGILSARITVSAVHGGDGSVHHTIALIEDVTEQLRAEAKLREMREHLAASEAQLRAFMDYSPAPMFIKDREGRYQIVNPKFLHDFGLAAGQVLGRTDAEIFPRDQAELFVKGDDRVRELRASIVVEEEALYVDGPHTSIVNKFPILDDKGEIAALGGVASDITERKRLERTLRENRRLLARAQELAGLGYWEYDVAANAVRASGKLRRMLGIRQHLPPQTPDWTLSLIHAEDRERVRAAVQRSVEEGRSYEFETRVVTIESGERDMLVSGEAVKDAAGRVMRIIGTCLDITEQRRRENALCDAADQLKALSRRLVEAQETERRRLAVELHDRVGQNLTALSINLDILQSRMKGLDADAKRRLRDSLALLDQTSMCVEGVLDDLRPPMLADWGLGPTVQWVAEDFSGRTEIPSRVRVQGTERRTDPQNELALVRIVQEALNNVAKHARAGKVEITLGWETDSVRVEVADDGVGFVYAGRDSQGGLGLVSMRERIQAAGGLLGIESAPGQGTRVRALLPG